MEAVVRRVNAVSSSFCSQSDVALQVLFALLVKYDG